MSLMQTSRTWGNKGTKIVELEGRANEISEVDSVQHSGSQFVACVGRRLFSVVCFLCASSCRRI